MPINDHPKTSFSTEKEDTSEKLPDYVADSSDELSLTEKNLLVTICKGGTLANH
jgi:hypothetical protein